MSDLRDRMPQSDTDQAGASTPPVAPQGALDPRLSDGSHSPIIMSLLEREGVLADGPFREIAEAVMATNSRRAEAELRAAILTAEATEKNWLPRLGPQLSLTSMGALAASLLVDTPLFDNGKRKAERAYARADIEVAAVALAEESNGRVLDALELYLDAEAARARAEVNRGAMSRMEHFAWVMGERVSGGINDQGDLQVVRQKLAQMRSDLGADDAKAQSARAQLAAMSATPLDHITGLSGIGADVDLLPSLVVLKAEAVAKRADAQADAAKAGALPGLNLGLRATREGITPGLNADFGGGIGFGDGARREAVEASREAAQARLVEEREASTRQLRALQGRLAEAERRASEAAAIAQHAASNYQLFERQLEAGRRPVPEVIGVFNTKIAAERAAIDYRYDVARLKLQIAALRGALVSGDKI